MIRYFVEIFFDSLRPLKLLSIALYLLAGVGIFLRQKDASGDVHLLLHIAPLFCWATMFLFMCVSRFLGLFYPQSGTVLTRRVTPVVGIVLWSYMFAASLVAPDFGMGLLYLVAASIEVWILARSITDESLFK